MRIKLLIFKISIYSIMILLTIFFMNISHGDIISLSVILIALFALISLTLYTFKEDKEDRKLLINIWRMYAPSILLLYSILFSIYGFISNKEIDFIKTDLNYNIQLKKDENINDIYKTYKEKMEKHKRIFEMYIIEKIKNNKQYDENNVKPNSNDDDKYIFWWAHPILLVINLLTLFMFMRLVTEMNFKRRADNYTSNFDSIIYKYY